MENTIKRLPTLDEVSYKSYREFYYDCLQYSKADFSVFKTAPDFVLKSPNVIPQGEFKVFEYTLAELKDAYLKELEERLEAIKKDVEYYKPNFSMRGCDVANNIYFKFFKNYF